jgi:hypothetical protein
MSTNNELNVIKKYVDDCAGYDISTKSRNTEQVSYRTLYFKIATDTTNFSLSKIGQMVNRDHATVLHAKSNLFDELMRNKRLSRLYDIFKVNVLKNEVDDHYKKEQQYEDLKQKYNELLAYKESLNERLISNDLLTDIEKEYRTLSLSEQEDYDKRASLIIKGYKWKKQNQEAEIIICNGGGLDARASLR